MDGGPRGPEKRATGGQGSGQGGRQGVQGEPRGRVVRVTREYAHAFGTPVLHCKNWGFGTNGQSSNRGVRSKSNLGAQWRSTESLWSPKRNQLKLRRPQKRTRGSQGSAQGAKTGYGEGGGVDFSLYFYRNKEYIFVFFHYIHPSSVRGGTISEGGLANTCSIHTRACQPYWRQAGRL